MNQSIFSALILGPCSFFTNSRLFNKNEFIFKYKKSANFLLSGVSWYGENEAVRTNLVSLVKP